MVLTEGSVAKLEQRWGCHRGTPTLVKGSGFKWCWTTAHHTLTVTATVQTCVNSQQHK